MKICQKYTYFVYLVQTRQTTFRRCPGKTLVAAFYIFFRRQQQLFTLIWSQIQNIEQFGKERQKVNPLQTCESYFVTFPKKICGVSVKRFVLQKTVQVDRRFYPDTEV